MGAVVNGGLCSRPQVFNSREAHGQMTTDSVPVVEIPAARRGHIEAPPGYGGVWEECSACHRDFFVSTPALLFTERSV